MEQHFKSQMTCDDSTPYLPQTDQGKELNMLNMLNIV
jgi:hypothetical protein